MRRQHELLDAGRRVRREQLYDWKHRCGQDFVDRQFRGQHGAEPHSYFCRFAPVTPPMIPNLSGNVVQFSSTISPPEPSAIVNNFKKGLTEIRAALGPAPRPIIVQIRVPKLALVPAPPSRRRVQLLSALLHAIVLAAVLDLPILFPGWTAAPTDTADSALSREANFEPLFFPVLPPIAAASRDAAKAKPGDAPDRRAESLPTAGQPLSQPAKPDYAGAQHVVSNPPHAPKGVQTIRRPDLASPPKMAFPLRLPSMVMLPHRAVPAPVPPRFEHSRHSNLEPPLSLSASEPPVQIRMSQPEKPKLLLAPSKPLPRKTTGDTEPLTPVLSDTLVPEGHAQKAAVIITAVHVPPQPAPVIPDAELASRFAIGPSSEAKTFATTPPGIASSSKAGQELPHLSTENGAGSKAEASDGHSVLASDESGVGTTARSSTGRALAAATGNRSIPGISIAGGVPGTNGRVAATSLIPRAPYALTIISGGSGGGASRDLGVFSRTDTVYSVSIPMADAGGGPDWPMQYALLNPTPVRNGSANGLLTPPVVLKKVQATAPKRELIENSGLVFVTGIIDENGKLAAVRPIRALDGRARSALNALAQWEFLAAQLNGKQVACKVLIGASVLATEEVK